MVRLVTPIMMLCLTGCVAAWGNSYKIESESSAALTIAYDPSLTDSHQIESVANQSCAHYGKAAVPKSQTMSGWGIARISFVCDTPLQAESESRITLRDLTVFYDPSPVQPPSTSAPTSPRPAIFTPPAAPASTPLPDLGQSYAPMPSRPSGGCIGVAHVPFNTALPCP